MDLIKGITRSKSDWIKIEKKCIVYCVWLVPAMAFFGAVLAVCDFLTVPPIMTRLAAILFLASASLMLIACAINQFAHKHRPKV